MSQLYDQDADQTPPNPWPPGSVGAEMWDEPPTIGFVPPPPWDGVRPLNPYYPNLEGGPLNYEQRPPDWGAQLYDERAQPDQGYAVHRAPRSSTQRRSIAVIALALIALTVTVVALVAPHSPARIKLNTVRPPTPTTVASVPTTAAPISPGPSTAPSPSTAPVAAGAAPTLPANQPSRFPTSNGGTASNTSGAAGVPVYYVAGGGPAGFKVPTVVDGVQMPYPGQAPTAAQVRAASTIPYVCPSNCGGPLGGVNWAAVDALAGEGWGPARP